MIPWETENRIIRHINKSADSADLELLDEWIKDSKNFLIYREYIKTHYAITIAMNDPDPSEIRSRLLSEIRKDKNKLKRLSIKTVFRYSAIFILFIAVGYLLRQDFNKTKVQEIEEILIPKEETITLTLENGDVRTISENASEVIVNKDGIVVGTQKGKQLFYDNEHITNTLVYNTLTVPYGKRFDIHLSDGTRVFLNAGTSLKYPVKFVPGQHRRVFLDGEAFFDVAKDAEHPFLVNSKEFNIKVLGTKFNVSNYEEDLNTEVVLVEGSVSLGVGGENNNLDNDFILKPSYKASLDRSERTITSEKVDTSLYTSWVDGIVVFKNSTFDHIMKKLERHYNVTIINNNDKLKHEIFNATIELERENIEDVLHYFSRVYNIEYNVVSNKVVIKQP